MSEVDAVRIREFLFNPQTPDYAFLTEEEVAEAFGAKSGTIRNWRPRGFPDPIDVPGKVAYDVGSIRAAQASYQRGHIGEQEKTYLAAGWKFGGKSL